MRPTPERGGVLRGCHEHNDNRSRNCHSYNRIGNELPDIFIPVYPTHGHDIEEFKVGEIYYPPDIKADPKYLKTVFREIDKDRTHRKFIYYISR